MVLYYLIFLFLQVVSSEVASQGTCFKDPSSGSAPKYYYFEGVGYHKCDEINHEASALKAHEKRELQTYYRNFRNSRAQNFSNIYFVSWHDAVSAFARKLTYKCMSISTFRLFDYRAPYFLYSNNIVKKFGKYAAFVHLFYKVKSLNETTSEELRKNAIQKLKEVLRNANLNDTGCATTFGCGYTQTKSSAQYNEYLACVFTPLKIEGSRMKYFPIVGKPCTRCDFYENDELTIKAKLEVKSNTCDAKYPNLCYSKIDDNIYDDSVGCPNIQQRQRIFINIPSQQDNSKCYTAGSSKNRLLLLIFAPIYLVILETCI